MSKYITKDDVWGIKRAVKKLWNKSQKDYWHHDKKDLRFDAFYNQQVPEAWRETLATVQRHAEDIRALLEDNSRANLIWYKRNGLMNSANLAHANSQFIADIENGRVELPTYVEIEEEKQQWQANPEYRKENGFSTPVREELIQIKIHNRKGGE